MVSYKVTKGPYTDEKEFIEKYVTRERIDKLLAKLKGIGEEIHKHTLIPRLFESIFYELIQEELYNFLKKGHRIIDFKMLRFISINKIKELTPELF